MPWIQSLRQPDATGNFVRLQDDRPGAKFSDIDFARVERVGLVVGPDRIHVIPGEHDDYVYARSVQARTDGTAQLIRESLSARRPDGLWDVLEVVLWPDPTRPSILQSVRPHPVGRMKTA